MSAPPSAVGCGCAVAVTETWCGDWGSEPSSADSRKWTAWPAQCPITGLQRMETVSCIYLSTYLMTPQVWYKGIKSPWCHRCPYGVPANFQVHKRRKKRAWGRNYNHMFLDWSLCLVWQGSLAETDNRSLNNERVVHDIIRHCLMFDSRSIGWLYITLWHPFPGNVHQKLTTIRNSLSRAVSRLCSALTSNCAQSAENWSHSARIFAE